MQNNNAFEISLWKSKSKYEFRVPIKQRDLYFDKNVHLIKLMLPDLTESIELKIRESFWNKCSHFGNVQVRDWLNEKNYIPYIKDNPPKFLLKKISTGSYQLTILK